MLWDTVENLHCPSECFVKLKLDSFSVDSSMVNQIYTSPGTDYMTERLESLQGNFKSFHFWAVKK